MTFYRAGARVRVSLLIRRHMKLKYSGGLYQDELRIVNNQLQAVSLTHRLSLALYCKTCYES